MTTHNTIMQAFEQAQIGETTVPDFRPGDTVKVSVKVREGNRERVQDFEGVVIARRNRGFNSSFTVRKISYSEGVERTFHLYSQQIASITVTRRGDVRRAKLYYLRSLSGKKARIKEKIVRKNKPAVQAKAASADKSPAAKKPVAAKTADKAPAAKKETKTATKTTKEAKA